MILQCCVRLILFSFLFLFSWFTSNSQVNRPVHWSKNYGGSVSDIPVTILPTADGGNIMCGTTKSNNFDIAGTLHGTASDIWVTKINRSGAIEWQKTYETTLAENARHIIATSDGGYAICGYTATTSILDDVNALAIKITSTGTVQWFKTFGGTTADHAWQIAETTDGGFAITGSSYGTPDGDFAGNINKGQTDLFIAKLSSNGTFLWAKLYGGTQNERGQVLRQLSDGNLLVAARAVSNNGDVVGNHNDWDSGDFWVLKFSPTGSIIWKKCYGSNGDESPVAGFEKNNRYYLTGTTRNLSHASNGDVQGVIDAYDMWFVTLDTAGNLVRQKCIGGTSSVDQPSDIAPTLDGHFVITGDSHSNDVYLSGNHGLGDVVIIKVDSLGTKLWSRSFGGSDYEFDGYVAVNADTTFSILGRARTVSGDVQAVYGFENYWLVNFRDTSLYQDLYSKLSGKAITYVGNKIIYKITYGRNNNAVASDTVVLQFVKDPRLQFLSSSKPISAQSGDTLIWKIHRSAVARMDTTILQFQMDPSVAMTPDSIRVKTIFGRYDPEFYQTNNVDSFTSKTRYQNAAISNAIIDITSQATVYSSKRVYYSIPHAFQSLLDTTRGIIKLVKDPKTDFIGCLPAYSSMAGDTIIWDFSTIAASYSSNIGVTLQIKDAPLVQLGDSIKNFVTLQFNTIDTGILKKTDSLRQIVTVICTPPNNVNTTLAPPQGIQWLRLFGGSDHDLGTGLAAVSDTSFVAIGSTSSNDADVAGSPPMGNGFVASYHSNGTMLWKKVIGGADEDSYNSAVHMGDGNLIVAGVTYSTDGAFSTNHGGSDILLTRFDSEGNTIWQKIIGGSNDDAGTPVIRRMRNNKYVVLTSTTSNDGDVVNPFTDLNREYPWIFVIDENGNIVSQKVLSDTLFNAANDIQVTLDNSFIIAGYKSRFTPPTFEYIETGRLLKTDSTGATLFLRNYNNAKYSQNIYGITANADSSFTFAGALSATADPNPGCIGDHHGYDTWVVKIDKTGNVLWQKLYGGSDHDQSYSILGTLDGGWLVSGSSGSSDGNATGHHSDGQRNYDAWTFKLDGNGYLEWQKMVGGNDEDELLGAIQLSSNEFILAGYTESYNNGDIYGSKGFADMLLFKIGASNVIRGMVYSDINGNHIKDSNEPYFTQGLVKSTKSNLASSSDIVNGYYGNSVDSGTYVTTPVINSTYYNPYPVAPTSSFNGYQLADTIDFAMVPVAGINDLRISMVPLTAARPGFALQYRISYENAGTTTITSGSVDLVKDPRTTFDSASLAHTSVVADTVSWSFSNLAPMEKKAFTVYLKAGIPPVVNNGDTLHALARINPIAGDSTILDNSSSVNQLVTGSYDPNDKTETHGPGFPMEALANGEYLNYVIRFQNTGTDTAFRVLVKDTLHHRLDLNSLEMIGSSHAYKLTIIDGNKLEWKFDPIILPDSNHNQAASNGFIAYRIRPLSTLSIGDSITNRASIYFDFNPPIVTNTAHTIIDRGNAACPGGVVVYKSGIIANSYQWQINNGSGWTNITDGAIYSGSATSALQLNAAPGSFRGNRYRCISGTANGIVTGPEFEFKILVSWTGTIDSNWENPGNWDCGMLPDETTDVVIKSATVIVNQNVSIRSLRLQPGVQFWVAAGVSFNVLH